MSELLVKKFIDALGRLELERELEPLVNLFAEDCEVGNVISPEKFHGRDDARRFWSEKYRDTFADVKSTFRNVFTTKDGAALEWVTEGTSNNGHQIRYEGVSILEIRGDLITRFRAYFDSASLGRQIIQQAHGQS